MKKETHSAADRLAKPMSRRTLALGAAKALAAAAAMKAAGPGAALAAEPAAGAASAAAAPAVYWSEAATSEKFVEIFNRLRADLGLDKPGAVKGRIGIKLHGDEVDFNRPLWQALQKSLPGSFYVECNWASAYSGGRGNTAGNIAAIESQGVPREEIDVLDREGETVMLPTQGGLLLKEASAPKALVDEYGLVAVTANFKIPSFAGYSGAVKNVGIGLVNSAGKAMVHGAGYRKTPEFFQRLADSARAVRLAMQGRILFINVVTDLKAPPLEGVPMHTGTLGIVGSLDMTACDQAVVDMIYGLSPKQYDAYSEAEKIERGFLQLECLAKIGEGSRAYRLVKI